MWKRRNKQREARIGHFFKKNNHANFVYAEGWADMLLLMIVNFLFKVDLHLLGQLPKHVDFFRLRISFSWKETIQILWTFVALLLDRHKRRVHGV